VSGARLDELAPTVAFRAALCPRRRRTRELSQFNGNQTGPRPSACRAADATGGLTGTNTHTTNNRHRHQSPCYTQTISPDKRALAKNSSGIITERHE
jgi:hypothetical protein